MCLADLASLVTHGANGVCGPPTLSWAAFALLLLGILGTLGLWSRRARSAITLCVLFALPGWWTLAQRRVDDEPVVRLRTSIEQFADRHARCVMLDSHACPACEPIARRARTPSVACDHPGVIELLSLEGHCVEQGERLVCGPN